MSNSSLILPAAVLFDMDGTLTEPMLDFPRIKAEMGIADRPILEALASLEPSGRKNAEAILLRHEEHAAANSKLNPGCLELLEWLSRRQIRTALITRNSRRSAQQVILLHRLKLDAVVTREDGLFKPDPAPLRIACSRLSVAQHEAWMVGDGIFDVLAGHAAGIRTVWLSHGRSREFEPAPWREVRDLPQLLEMLKAAAAP